MIEIKNRWTGTVIYSSTTANTLGEAALEAKGTDGSRFRDVLSAVVGRRLTYRLLTAQGDAGFMGIA